LSEPAETIVGAIQVSARLQSGSELLTLVFTQKRLILAHIGKRSLGELPGLSALGRWGAGAEGILRSPGESRRKELVKRGAAGMSPDEIMNADKDNFDIPYTDVVRVELDNGIGLVEIMMLTKDDKFHFETSRDFDNVSKLLRDALGDKVEASG
jgi:hypothetical protein